MTTIDITFGLIILVFSVIVHELSHGYVALMLGDATAKYAGRLTLNPLKHLDPIGSFLVPLITYWSGGFIFGWAKPVPYNPYNLRGGKWSPALVAVAGPLSNLLIAIMLAIVLHFLAVTGLLSQAFAKICIVAIATNIFLAFFNLIPIPPLDGSKVIAAALPPRFFALIGILERYQIIFMILLIFFGWRYVAFIPNALIRLIIF